MGGIWMRQKKGLKMWGGGEGRGLYSVSVDVGLDHLKPKRVVVLLTSWAWWIWSNDSTGFSVITTNHLFQTPDSLSTAAESGSGIITKCVCFFWRLMCWSFCACEMDPGQAAGRPARGSSSAADFKARSLQQSVISPFMGTWYSAWFLKHEHLTST